MFKSVFHRLLVSFIGILTVILLLMTIVMSFVLNNNLIQHKQDEMLTVARQVQALYPTLNDSSAKQWQAMVNVLAQSTDNRIYVYTGVNPKSLKPLMNTPEDFTSNLQVRDLLKRIFQGETVKKRKYLSQSKKEALLFAGIPLLSGQNVTGAILIFSPVNRVRLPRNLIWFVTLFSFLVAAIVIFFISRRLSKRIEDMQKAAMEIAQGRFDRQIKIEGQDEVAQLAASFNFMQNRLQQIEEMRKDLIANVSHELRTPLTTIRGFIQAILEKVIKPEEYDNYLLRAYDETNRLYRLVSDLLQLARLHAGTIKADKSSLDLNRLVSETVDESQLFADGKNIILEKVIPSSPLTAIVDRDKIKQVMLNLIHNALIYTPEGGKVVVQTQLDSGKAVIRVKDTGSGIPPEQLELIFMRFHRGETRVPGTGLGLSIAKELVELHGGKIYALSKVGQGTEMIVEL